MKVKTNGVSILAYHTKLLGQRALLMRYYSTMCALQFASSIFSYKLLEWTLVCTIHMSYKAKQKKCQSGGRFDTYYFLL